MDEALLEILDAAIYQEVASQAIYDAALAQANDPTAAQLLRELAAEEVKHADWLKELRLKGVSGKTRCHLERVPNLKLSDYLSAPESLHQAGLQEILAFAIKREQDAVDFYSRMMSTLTDPEAKKLCECLVQDELKHKLRLELYYEELYLKEA